MTFNSLFTFKSWSHVCAWTVRQTDSILNDLEVEPEPEPHRRLVTFSWHGKEKKLASLFNNPSGDHVSRLGNRLHLLLAIRKASSEIFPNVAKSPSLPVSMRSSWTDYRYRNRTNSPRGDDPDPGPWGTHAAWFHPFELHLLSFPVSWRRGTRSVTPMALTGWVFSKMIFLFKMFPHVLFWLPCNDLSCRPLNKKIIIIKSSRWRMRYNVCDAGLNND